MSKIKRPLSFKSAFEHEDHSDLSVSDSEHEFGATFWESDLFGSDSEKDGPAPVKRQHKIPKKYKGYLGPSSQSPQEILKGWCIIEWAGEDAYDAVAKKDISSLENELSCPKFEIGENVLALYCGKPFQGIIAATADTKAAALKLYKSHQQPNFTDRSKSRKDISLSNKSNKLKRIVHHELIYTKPVPNFTSVEVRKEENLSLEGPSKKKNEKNRSRDKTAEQMRKEEKERKNKAELAQMQNICKSPEIIQIQEEVAETELIGKCCKCCKRNKLAIERHQQEMDLMRKKISALAELDLESMKSKRQMQNKPVEFSPKTPNVMSQRPSGYSSDLKLKVIETVQDNCPAVGNPEKDSCPQEFFYSSATMSSVPHHLKTKAASASAVTKATRILAIGMFTFFERLHCTISGATGKNGATDSAQGKKFDHHRVTLIQDFLRTVYPKTHNFAIVNRIIGQVAIETRNGRHRQSDEIVLSILNAKTEENMKQ